MCSIDDVDTNVEAALAAIDRLRGCDLITLPENALYLRLAREKGALPHKFDLKEKFWSRFATLAKKNDCDILIGSAALSAANKSVLRKNQTRPTNSMIHIDHNGKVKSVYDKIHLFDVDVEGAPPVRESDAFSAGKKPKMLNIRDWRIGLSICYDMRFSDLYLNYAEKNAHLILVPSAFLVPTGQAHWHTLLRARAIESQAYVVAAAQSGGHRNLTGGQRETFGHSLAIDPWGVQLADVAQNGAAETSVELDAGKLLQVWQQIPMSQHRV